MPGQEAMPVRHVGLLISRPQRCPVDTTLKAAVRRRSRTPDDSANCLAPTTAPL